MMWKLFFDNNGVFQWASIAAMIAFVVGCFSIYNNYKTLKTQKELSLNNFKGNVVSKARIEWIQEVRKKSVDFISICYDLIMNIKSNNYSKDKVLDLKSQLKKNANLLILYFGPDKNKNENNEFIIYLITLLSNKIVNENNYYDGKHIINLETELSVLMDFLRIYLKAEWKRANGELLDEKVQEYLEEHKIYKDIKEIYRSGFNSHEECVDCFYNKLKQEYNCDD